MNAFTVLDVVQRSDEWAAARAGRLTASVADAAIGRLKSGGETAARRDLRFRIVAERLTGKPLDDNYVSQWMQRGIDLQPDAIAAYEGVTGHLVEEVGFCAHNLLQIGCSPDGLIDGGRAGIELKVPKIATHVSYLRTGGVPADYVPQLLHSLWVTGADWWDFVSFAPDLPERLQLFVVRFPRNAEAITDYERKAITFLDECDRELEALQTMGDLRGQLHALL